MIHGYDERGEDKRVVGLINLSIVLRNFRANNGHATTRGFHAEDNISERADHRNNNNANPASVRGFVRVVIKTRHLDCDSVCLTYGEDFQTNPKDPILHSPLGES